MHSLKAAPLRLIPPGLITMSPPHYTAPVLELPVHVALARIAPLAPAHQALLDLPTVMLALAH